MNSRTDALSLLLARLDRLRYTLWSEVDSDPDEHGFRNALARTDKHLGRAEEELREVLEGLYEEQDLGRASVSGEDSG